MNLTALGRQIKAAREMRHMTQEQLSAAVDYSVDHISVIERGKKAPRLDKLVEIANVLGVSMDYLLQEDLISANVAKASDISERLHNLSPDNQRSVLKMLNTIVSEFEAQ